MKLRHPLFHEGGVELSGPKEAFEALRAAAREAIAESDRLGTDVRSRGVRVTDEAGSVIFDGTLEEAAGLHIDGRVILNKES